VGNELTDAEKEAIERAQRELERQVGDQTVEETVRRDPKNK